VMFYVFIKASDWSEELKVRQELILAILSLAQHLDIKFSLPTQRLDFEPMSYENGFSVNPEGDKPTSTPNPTEFLDELKLQWKVKWKS